MKFSKLLLLLTFAILIGCNQSDSEDTSTPPENQNSASEQPQTTTDNQSAIEPESTVEPERAGKVVARVNGKSIYEDDLNGKNLDFVITEEIIYQVGLQQGVDEEIRRKVRDLERILVIQKTKASLREDMPPAKEITDEDIQKYYDNNKDKYMHVRIHEISMPDVNLGIEIKKKAEGGEDLQEIANSYPEDAITVTDIGYNRQLAQEFANKEVGSISEVIQKPNGTFSVLKIVEIKEMPLKVNKKSIRHILESQRIGEMFDNYARRLANENNMEIEKYNDQTRRQRQ
ncbi:MAG: hypothetical protein DHS20C13_22930 [Thermodesulfobacteriota bacterium]|nr:MAG: hypothetical protein DHS20C13_22930 [Thermodesulfobacteriota bacterium]